MKLTRILGILSIALILNSYANEDIEQGKKIATSNIQHNISHVEATQCQKAVCAVTLTTAMIAGAIYVGLH